MESELKTSNTFQCSCGRVAITGLGSPIMSVSCFCASCQMAARQLSQGGERTMSDADGGTPVLLYRKDRLRFSTSPADLLEHRLTPESSTRRIVSACCQSPMFLEFQSGHWLSLYSHRLPEDRRPKIQLRTMTRDAPAGADFSDGIPSPSAHTFGFMGRLVWAWVQMGFRVPKVEIGGPLLPEAAQR